MSFGLTVPGRLGADPDVRHTSGGTVVANFRVAVSGYDHVEKEKTTTWIRVTMWGARGEQLAKLLSKGDAVCFIGTGELKSYENKNGDEVVYIECTASDCALLGSSRSREDERDSKRDSKRSKRDSKRDDDDEIPF